ncbi:MAG: nicotinamide mononucleotide transporter [Candidatus Improbicoccus devescovinae]|nr:MAG: nicotinamide mononucleotide transporter [Candidatus Improbicoccus devescovinae]GMB10674.1 MAG: nicotinamide mononucleotide transporter [Candidatus Improbicoccus devescovinae]
MINQILSWTFCIIAFIGTVLTTKMNRYGFLCWIFSNIYMICHFLLIKEYAQLALNTAYLCMAIYGRIEWGKNKIQ